MLKFKAASPVLFKTAMPAEIFWLVVALTAVNEAGLLVQVLSKSTEIFIWLLTAAFPALSFA